ncbi:uncharacterized protein LOC131947707 [Physella acuta]|uniref:uncharacterized protein LOC131947707 n=1 Tax=Physella acuta TaxID=109671 RepID=UPI0027DB2517|nr:uncharacterized protein LOC131947707 [Physella acuta]XP_059164966.1 uncharacterized protein LOC131947707 [Physella acuta]
MSIILALLVCLPMVFGQDINQVADASFRSMDGNHDGHIVRSEVNTYFDGYDQNNDGHVTRGEYTHHVDQLYHDPTVNRVLHGIFNGLDSDSDGVLDNDDYTALFSSADSNNNNQVTHQEYVNYFHTLVN